MEETEKELEVLDEGQDIVEGPAPCCTGGAGLARQ